MKTRVDLLSSRALFRYLTQVLDYKILEFIAKNSRKYLQTALSINLNIETVLSETFADFDKVTEADFKKNIVIEIQVGDVFADIQAFNAARKAALCIDGESEQGLVVCVQTCRRRKWRLGKYYELQQARALSIVLLAREEEHKMMAVSH